MKKQYNLKGNSGLYLTTGLNVNLNENNFKNELIFDREFFIKDSRENNQFIFKNSSFDNLGGLFLGSNSTQKSNTDLKYSEIERKDILIQNKIYYNSFDFYFRYYGSTISKYKLPGVTANDTRTILNNLRVRLFVQIGVNIVPLKLTNLQGWDNNDGIYKTQNPLVPNEITVCGSGSGNVTITDYYIDLKHHFGGDCPENWLKYKDAPNGYNFRLKTTFPDFNQKSINGKSYKIIVRYYNIAVTGTPHPYNQDEAIELMSNTFTFFEDTSVTPTPIPPPS